MPLTHIDSDGRAVMVDVSQKPKTAREAVAEGEISLNEAAYLAVQSKTAKKGDVLTVAEIAGITAMKRTSDTIPLAHNIPLTSAKVVLTLCDSKVVARAVAKTNAETGVEMEALNGVSVALLTVYDMLKAVDRGMVISRIRLLEKRGGKSGEYIREE